MKSYCTLFSRIKNCFWPVLFKFFFFFLHNFFLSLPFFSFSILSPLFSILHISPLFSVDFVVAWWLTVGNGLGFVPISISAWWHSGWRLETSLGLCRSRSQCGGMVVDSWKRAWAWVDSMIWLFWMTFDFDFSWFWSGWFWMLEIGRASWRERV